MGIQIGLIRLINLIYQIFNLLILIRVILSWIPNVSPYDNDIVRSIYKVTDFVMEPIRDFLYNRLGLGGPIDISPLIAIFLLRLVRGLLIRILI